MLRLAEGIIADTTLVACLAGMYQYSITLKALNPGLQCASLRNADYGQVQEWLGAVNDMDALDRSFKAEASGAYQNYSHFKHQATGKGGKDLGVTLGYGPLMTLVWRIAPRNWIEANNAFALTNNLVLCGNGGEESWRGIRSAVPGVARKIEAAASLFSVGLIDVPNPRRIIGCISFPHVSGVWEKAAENLFYRRCAILTCAMHRHRLAHGGFPEELANLDAAFLQEPMKDPAKAGALLNYRKTERGFLLWSVGEDRNDDGGDAAKDWIWRHER